MKEGGQPWVPPVSDPSGSSAKANGSLGYDCTICWGPSRSSGVLESLSLSGAAGSPLCWVGPR